MRTLDRIVHQGKVNWILEADIMSFFDSLDRDKLVRCSWFGWPMGR